MSIIYQNLDEVREEANILIRRTPKYVEEKNDVSESADEYLG
jgi:hypothetical protein